MPSTGATLLIYATGNGSGVVDSRGTPDYEQTGVNLLAVTHASGNWHGITLTTPFPITAGQQYTFIIETVLIANAKLYCTDSNTYAGGALFPHYGNSDPSKELNFRVWESASAPTPVKIWPFILFFTIPFVFIIVRKMKKTGKKGTPIA